MNKQRERKNRISDGLTLAMGKIGWIALLLVLFVGAPVYGLWALLGEFEYSALRWIAVGVTVGLLPAFGLGFFFGKAEVKGFLGGFDRALDGLAAAVDLRDASKERRAAIPSAPARPATPPPGALNVYLPTITTRAALPQTDVVDL